MACGGLDRASTQRCDGLRWLLVLQLPGRQVHVEQRLLITVCIRTKRRARENYRTTLVTRDRYAPAREARYAW